MVSRRETVWPTPEEIDLLHAALAEPAAARAAWDRWRLETGGIPDGPSRRLLPLAEWNLRRGGGPSEPSAGFVEHGSIRALAIADAAAPVLAAFREAGVRVLVLKGLALANTYYPHPGLRSMSDVDLLVAPSDAAPAAAVLSRLGWRMAESEPPARLRHLHGAAWRREGAPEIDLHTRALAESAAPGADAGFFARARPLAVGGAPAETLSPADHLLVACVHGLRWSASPAIHWVADAAMLLRSGEVDWETLLREVRARRLASPLLRALRLLSGEFGEAVPASVLDGLAAGDSRSGRRELTAWMSRPSLAGGLYLHWRRFAQESEDASLLRRLRGFPAHLKEMWALEDAWRVPAAALRKSVDRLRKR